MGEFNSNDHYIYYCGQESLRRNGVAITVNKRVRNAVLGCSLKNDRMISVCFQGKPFNITVIQVCALTSNAEETEQFYERPTRPSRTNTQKRCPLYYRGLECKSRKSRNTWKVIVKLLSCVQLFTTPWTVVNQAPPSMGFSRQEYWSGLPFPSPGDLPDPGIEPGSPALQADALPSEPPGKFKSNQHLLWAGIKPAT